MHGKINFALQMHGTPNHGKINFALQMHGKINSGALFEKNLIYDNFVIF
jgi:hypothetical protein